MLKRIITCLLALSLLAGVQVSFAAEKAGAEAGPISKAEHSQYPRAYEKAILAARSEVPATAEYQGLLKSEEAVFPAAQLLIRQSKISKKSLAWSIRTAK